jgi:hypothetical protein
MIMDYNRRINPTGFEGSTKAAPVDPQKAQQTNDVNVLIRSDQTVTREPMGSANTTPGPRG